MSLALEPANKSGLDKFSKALQRFMREDPTFRVGFDAETKQTIIRFLASPTIPPKTSNFFLMALYASSITPIFNAALGCHV
jgi:hypothetical protein